MANLLPSSERQAIVHERTRRLATATLILISGVFVFGTVLLVPSFVIAVSSREAGNVRLETTRRLLDRQKNSSGGIDVESINEKIDFVVHDDGSMSASEALERVVALVPEGVALQSVLWRSEGEHVFLDMTGSAGTRSSLIAFGDSLRSSGLFAEVVIPIESLAQQVDLQFRLSLTFAQ